MFRTLPNSSFVLLLGSLFLLSGATGLVYEVIWFRLLFLNLGGTGLSVATVTAFFMAGLGFGAWLFGTRLAQSIPAVRLYALLEAFIGLYALLVPVLVGAAGRLDTLLLGGEAEGGTARLIRFLMAGMVLLPPTVCMGGTLPALSRLVEVGQLRPGPFVGALYGLNTTGAVLGAGSAGFLLLPRIGFLRTLLLCSAANLALAGAAYLLSRRQPAVREDAPAAARQAIAASSGRPRLALFAYTASGFIAFLLQVSWTRILTLVFGSSVYAFSLILVLFLLGLGFGALVASRFARSGSPGRGLAWTFVAAGGAALLGQGLYGRLPYLYLEAILKTEGGLPLGVAGLLAAVLILPTTFALGAGFPLAVRLATGDDRPETAARVGRLYAGNTAGSVLGAFLTALVLIPALGLAGVIGLASLLALAVGTVLSFRIRGGAAPVRGLAAWSAPAAAATAALIWFFAIPAWNPNLMSQSMAYWRSLIEERGEEGIRELLEEVWEGERFRLLYYRDGVTSTVALKAEERPNGGREHYLTVDGKVDASDRKDMPTNVLLGHLPLFVGSRPARDILVIGYGSGVTVGSVLTHPVSSVVTVEIEEATIEAAEYFDPVNGRPLEDPRTRLLINDGRAYLARTDRRFDVIISEPSSAWLSGPAKLFTREAFELFRDRLKADGVLCQWLQTYDLDEESLLTVLRTLQGVFPNVAMFATRIGDVILLASPAPIVFPWNHLRDGWSIPAVRQDLGRIGFRGPCGLLDRLLADPEGVRKMIPDGPLNTDDNALLEYRGPRTAGIPGQEDLLARFRAISRGAAALLAGSDSAIDFDPNQVAMACLREGARGAAASIARRWVRENPDADGLWVLGQLDWQENRRLEALARFDDAIGIDAGHHPSLVSRAMTLQELGRWEEALAAWNRAAEAGVPAILVRSYRGIARFQSGDPDGALEDLSAARAEAGGRILPVPIELYLALIYEDRGRLQEARGLLETFLGRLPPGAPPSPSGVAVLERLAALREGTGEGGEPVESLRLRAERERQELVGQLVSDAEARLAQEGEGSARAYLDHACRIDPMLRGALREEVERRKGEDGTISDFLQRYLSGPGSQD